ncbi:hypothetical protein [Brachybacterium sp. GU-2]|uniref:hypothetical protein n=1 Tax=Brachybacterium sp. GU-2 TaxID=3069708 RepID=UPI00280AEA97|nr:hypothetical protein [Brachybacterium sp. GU-2]WME23232.1 hypothetical protein RBL05_00350 [Brachybacterium sp. GU-2]
MGKRAAVMGSFAPARTSVRSAIGLVVSMVAVFCLAPTLIKVALMFDRSSTAEPFLGDSVLRAGEQITEYLGWGFGVVATVQFGVLVAIVGGQMALGDQEQEADVRSFLLALGVLPITALTPAMFLLTVGATRSAEAGTALVIAVPVYLTMLAIAVFIATFEPGPESLLLKRAQKRKTRADNRVDTLDGLPRVNPALALVACGVAHLLVCVVIPFVIARNFEWDPLPTVRPVPVFIPIAGALVVGAFSAFILILASASQKPDPTPLDVMSSWVFVALSYSMDLVMTMLLSVWLPAALLGVLVVVIARTVVVVGIRRDAKKIQEEGRAAGRGWTVTGLVTRAGTFVAARWADAELVNSAKHLARMEERARDGAQMGQGRLF